MDAERARHPVPVPVLRFAHREESRTLGRPPVASHALRIVSHVKGAELDSLGEGRRRQCGRARELLGLEVGDVSFDRKTITFRPNQWRRLKTATSLRAVPLWPQLEAVLRAYVFDADRPPSRLLFPSYRTGEETMLTDFRKLLDTVAVRAGWQAGEIRSRMFRHTYCAARLQTLDQGAPVSLFTAAKELGHGGEAMVRRVYGHLGQVRHRAEEVEYRIEAFEDKLKGRLAALRGAV